MPPTNRKVTQLLTFPSPEGRGGVTLKLSSVTMFFSVRHPSFLHLPSSGSVTAAAEEPEIVARNLFITETNPKWNYANAKKDQSAETNCFGGARRRTI